MFLLIFFNSFWKFNVSYFRHHVLSVSFFLGKKTFSFDNENPPFIFQSILKFVRIFKFLNFLHFLQLFFSNVEHDCSVMLFVPDQDSISFDMEKLTFIFSADFIFFWISHFWCVSRTNLFSEKFVYLLESK